MITEQSTTLKPAAESVIWQSSSAADVTSTQFKLLQAAVILWLM